VQNCLQPLSAGLKTAIIEGGQFDTGSKRGSHSGHPAPEYWPVQQSLCRRLVWKGMSEVSTITPWSVGLPSHSDECSGGPGLTLAARSFTIHRSSLGNDASVSLKISSALRRASRQASVLHQRGVGLRSNNPPPECRAKACCITRGPNGSCPCLLAKLLGDVVGKTG